MRGVMLKMTPVLRNEIELTIGAPAIWTLVADCVAIGTSSPICRTARLLLSVIRDGDEMTFTLVIPASALSRTLAFAVFKK